jgi:hypothetical protein
MSKPALTHVERQHRSGVTQQPTRIGWFLFEGMIVLFARPVFEMHTAKAGFSADCLITTQQLWRMQHVRRHVHSQLVQM